MLLIPPTNPTLDLGCNLDMQLVHVLSKTHHRRHAGGDEFSDQYSECTTETKIAAICLQHPQHPPWRTSWRVWYPSSPVPMEEGNLFFWNQTQWPPAPHVCHIHCSVFCIALLLCFIQKRQMPVVGYQVAPDISKWGKRRVVLLGLSPTRFAINPEVFPVGGKPFYEQCTACHTSHMARCKSSFPGWVKI